jgi:hypothetical protein
MNKVKQAKIDRMDITKRVSISELNHLAWALVHNVLDPEVGFSGCSCDLCSLLRDCMKSIREKEAQEYIADMHAMMDALEPDSQQKEGNFRDCCACAKFGPPILGFGPCPCQCHNKSVTVRSRNVNADETMNTRPTCGNCGSKELRDFQKSLDSDSCHECGRRWGFV